MDKNLYLLDESWLKGHPSTSSVKSTFPYISFYIGIIFLLLLVCLLVVCSSCKFFTKSLSYHFFPIFLCLIVFFFAFLIPLEYMAIIESSKVFYSCSNIRSLKMSFLRKLALQSNYEGEEVFEYALASYFLFCVIFGINFAIFFKFNLMLGSGSGGLIR